MNGMWGELLQFAQLVIGVILVPAAYGCVVKLFEIERRLSHIEGKLNVTERAQS